MIYYETVNEIFTQTIAVIVAISYINMGATIDLSVIKQIAKRPIGPLIGILCQYVVMPLVSQFF